MRVRQKLLEYIENMNDRNIKTTHGKVTDFGKIVYTVYVCKNSSIDLKSLGFSNFSLTIPSIIWALIFFDIGYDYLYFTEEHINTIKYASIVDNVVNDIDSYKQLNVNFSCQGWAKQTIKWNFSEFPLFVEYMRSMGNNEDKKGTVKYKKEDMCWLTCSYRNNIMLRENGWDLQQLWRWLMVQLPAIVTSAKRKCCAKAKVSSQIVKIVDIYMGYSKCN